MSKSGSDSSGPKVRMVRFDPIAAMGAQGDFKDDVYDVVYAYEDEDESLSTEKTAVSGDRVVSRNSVDFVEDEILEEEDSAVLENAKIDPLSPCVAAEEKEDSASKNPAPEVASASAVVEGGEKKVENEVLRH